MNSKCKRYLFDDAGDMIRLAQEIQSHVHWHHRWTDVETGASISYYDLWFCIDSAHENGYIGISITSDDEIEFLIA